MAERRPRRGRGDDDCSAAQLPGQRKSLSAKGHMLHPPVPYFSRVTSSIKRKREYRSNVKSQTNT
jgi:hypothetical protein